jgi:hypothetical protein
MITHLSPQELELLKPLAEARAAQLAGENYQARLSLIAELEALSCEERERMPKLEAQAGAALASFEEARQRFEETHRTAERAAADAEVSRLDFERRANRLRMELSRSAPADISDLEVALRAGEMRTRDTFYARQMADGLLMLNGRHHPQMVTVTNADEIAARIDAIRRALTECENLRLQATPPDELARRLDEIRREALRHLPSA